MDKEIDRNAKPSTIHSQCYGIGRLDLSDATVHTHKSNHAHSFSYRDVNHRRRTSQSTATHTPRKHGSEGDRKSKDLKGDNQGPDVWYFGVETSLDPATTTPLAQVLARSLGSAPILQVIVVVWPNEVESRDSIRIGVGLDQSLARSVGLRNSPMNIVSDTYSKLYIERLKPASSVSPSQF
ncbi:hypothetical protein BDM02DRAFT_1796977 [Thelephora ganbajun]|uniref:Uncharacterized protein n=1 Tax=Thelephora ganbajun TaxID=370292 RepID=A0ACB6Z098_THEGA|nr:hypothetical protein BDM02DRAFT_1796977 [Thelephora ganbajun]